MIRILLVDDQKMIREALKMSLEPETDFQIIGTADNGISALEQVEKLQPDIVLMNIEMPGLDGTSATQFITNKFDHTKVLILSSEDSDEYIAKSLSVGAKGYILKNTDFHELADTIRSVHRGYTQIGPGLMEKLLVKTDSGAILSKLGGFKSSQNKSLLDREKVFVAKTKRAITNLRNTSRSQKNEQQKLKFNLEQIQQELLKSKKTIAQQSKYIRFTWIFLSISLPLLCLSILSLYSRISSLEKDLIPIERVGLYGEYNLSGLAQRVANTYRQDFVLSNIDTIYVAQNGNNIVLKGIVNDAAIISRMVTLAKDVQGVDRVDTSQIVLISP